MPTRELVPNYRKNLTLSQLPWYKAYTQMKYMFWQRDCENASPWNYWAEEDTVAVQSNARQGQGEIYVGPKSAANLLRPALRLYKLSEYVK